MSPQVLPENDFPGWLRSGHYLPGPFVKKKKKNGRIPANSQAFFLNTEFLLMFSASPAVFKCCNCYVPNFIFLQRVYFSGCLFAFLYTAGCFRHGLHGQEPRGQQSVETEGSGQTHKPRPLWALPPPLPPLCFSNPFTLRGSFPRVQEWETHPRVRGLDNVCVTCFAGTSQTHTPQDCQSSGTL